MCAAPTVLSAITADPAKAVSLDRSIWLATGGSPPAPALLARARECGLGVTHLYGMTETYGPVVINEWRREWDALPGPDRDRLGARQGIGNVVSDLVRVIDATGSDVPADAKTIGEIAFRGDNVTPGYYNDPEATANAIPDGWFRSGVSPSGTQTAISRSATEPRMSSSPVERTSAPSRSNRRFSSIRRYSKSPLSQALTSVGASVPLRSSPVGKG